MKNPSDKKMSTASLSGVCICSICYILVGNMGYCLFGNNIGGNFLLSFQKDNIN
jgi:amino acid permease